jgi:threonine/homoserine/homoserine lactone efflux protein
MVGFGGLLVILGIGSLLLPMFDIQFQIMSLFDDFQPAAGIAVAAIGAVLLYMGIRRQRAQRVETAQAVAAQQPPVTQEPPTT